MIVHGKLEVVDTQIHGYISLHGCDIVTHEDVTPSGVVVVNATGMGWKVITYEWTFWGEAAGYSLMAGREKQEFYWPCKDGRVVIQRTPPTKEDVSNFLKWCATTHGAP